MTKHLLALGLAVAAFGVYSPSAAAYQTGDWVLRAGIGSVQPDGDNGTLAGTLDLEIDSDLKPTAALSYFFTDRVAVQVLAAYPFEHDYKLNGAESGSLRHLPPTVTLQYHFNPAGPLNVYVGAGLNYTLIFDEEIVIPGAKLSLDNSIGLAAEFGVEYALNDKWGLGAQLWWVDIDSDAKLNGADIGTANVDPIVVGIALSYRF
jgi:outer membrane protein